MTEFRKSEFDVMRILWEKGPLRPAEIQELFAWRIDNGTLRSVLRVLMEKGHLKRRKVGNAFVYRANASRQRLQSRMARLMADVFTGGSTADLIAQLIKTEKLSSREIEELSRITEEKASDVGSKGKAGKGK